jgi:hypothetical protein
MDLSRARVILRERGVLDVLDLALRFLVAHAGAYTKVTLVAILPAALVSFWVASSAGWLAGWTATVLLALFVQAPFTVLASRLVFETDVRVGSVLGASLRGLPRLLLPRIVQLFLLVATIAILVGALASSDNALIGGASVLAFMLLIPALWIGIALLFVVEAALLERAKMGAAISRSLRIIRGHSGYALIAASTLFLLHATAALLGDDVGRFVVSGLFQFKEPEAIWSAGGSWLALLGFWLFLPYSATARFFVYLDLRTRSEGWDIQTRFVAIALRAQETRAAA